MSDWAGAGASVLGGVLGMIGQGSANAANASMAREAANFNLYSMMENQRFQERMSSTAYQRAMNDMRYAGLNPILAYSQGGATTPGGMGASMQAATMENTMEALGEGVSSAGQKAKDWATADLAKEQSKNTASQTELNKANEVLAKTLDTKAQADAAVSAQQLHKVKEETDNVILSRDLIRAQTHSAAGAANASNAQADNTRRQTETTSRWGPSTWGGLADTIERALTRGAQTINRDPAHSARGYETSPKSLRDLRPEWFK